MDSNHIYTEFMSNKQLFKPFVSWPDCVHLGLNNVDAISNKLLNDITLRRGNICYGYLVIKQIGRRKTMTKKLLLVVSSQINVFAISI